MKTNSVYTIDKEAIVYLLKTHGISQRQADTYCGFHPGMIWKIINSRGQNYTVDTLTKLSLYFKQPMEYFVKKQKKATNPIRKNYNKK
jgi:transcriptional regulator with XRE-family HTH domain